MGQFFTGMVFGWTGCARLAGVKAATATNAAPCNSTELSFKNVERGHSEFIVAVSFFPRGLARLPMMVRKRIK
jgi:hypothetical protein